MEILTQQVWEKKTWTESFCVSHRKGGAGQPRVMRQTDQVRGLNVASGKPLEDLIGTLSLGCGEDPTSANGGVVLLTQGMGFANEKVY